MKHDTRRSDFLIAVAGGFDRERLTLKNLLKTCGFRVDAYDSFDDCLLNIRENPPHILIPMDSNQTMGVLQFIDLIHIMSQDILIFPILSPLDRSLIDRVIERGVYDVLFNLSIDFKDVLVRMDRVVDHLLMKYTNEQLIEKMQLNQKAYEDQVQDLPERKMARALEKIDATPSMDVLFELAVQEFIKISGGTRGALLRYLPGYKSFLVLRSSGLSLKENIAYGVKTSNAEIQKSLLDEAYVEFRQKLIPAERPLLEFVIEGGPLEMFVFLAEDFSLPDTRPLLIFLNAFERRYKNFSLQQRLTDTVVEDELTQCLSKKYFRLELEREFRRAQRIKSSLAVIYLEIQNYSSLKKDASESEVALILKRLGLLLHKTARLTDRLGYLGHGQFAMVLAHTDIAGARMKGRRLLEQARAYEFSKSCHLSLGAAEMNSENTDIDALMAAASDHLEDMANLERDTLSCLSQ